MKHFGRLTKSLTIMAFGAVGASAMAYEEDTHFQVTYILCRGMGMTPDEALTVAAVDQGTDDSNGTVAVTNYINYHEEEEWRWHALDLGGRMGASGIIDQKEKLFRLAMSRPTVAEKLKYFGVFMHFQQDTWAHRKHNDGHSNSVSVYNTYSTPYGHAEDMHQPDRPPFDPVAAFNCLEDANRYVWSFVKDGLGRTPNAFFTNYHNVGSTAATDPSWSRRGRLFNQLAPYNGSDLTARFLNELIRTQIDCYTSSLDIRGYTADEVKLDRTREAFNAMCRRYGALNVEIIVPTKAEKEAKGFNKMTTKELLNGAN